MEINGLLQVSRLALGVLVGWIQSWTASILIKRVGNPDLQVVLAIDEHNDCQCLAKRIWILWSKSWDVVMSAWTHVQMYKMDLKKGTRKMSPELQTISELFNSSRLITRSAPLNEHWKQKWMCVETHLQVQLGRLLGLACSTKMQKDSGRRRFSWAICRRLQAWPTILASWKFWSELKL